MDTAEMHKHRKRILEEKLVDIVQNALEWGFVVTIDLAPHTPLAMGNYTHKIEVRLCNDEYARNHETHIHRVS